MKKIIIILLSAFFFILFFSPQYLFAQSTDNIANCDLCGYCTGSAPPSNWGECRDCLYPEVKGLPSGENKTLIGIPTPDPNRYYTMIGCLSTRPGEFAQQAGRIFFSLIGGVAFLFLLYGAGIIATSQGNPEKLNRGKRTVYGAITGLLFVIFSMFLVRLIAVDILKIPGFGG